MDIVVLGVGKYGSALSKVFKNSGHTVHCVKKNQPWPQISQPFVSLLAVPTQAIPQAVNQRKKDLAQSAIIVSTAKGLVQRTKSTPLESIRQGLKKTSIPLVALSGPGFASEIKRNDPTALVLASKNLKKAQWLSHNLSNNTLRFYPNSDPLGVELCGALKNIYAIAAGMTMGLGFGDSTRAALNSRSMIEMQRIGKTLGAQPLTFFGLAGAGDLFLTATSKKSRNFQFGLGLARGISKSKLLSDLGTVEGVWTCKAASQLVSKHRIRAPIVQSVEKILKGRLTPKKALKDLMSGKIRNEFE